MQSVKLFTVKNISFKVPAIRISTIYINDLIDDVIKDIIPENSLETVDGEFFISADSEFIIVSK